MPGGTDHSARIDSIGRADFGTGTAAGALARINDPSIVLLTDGFKGAFGFANAAIDAIVVDGIGHSGLLYTEVDANYSVS